MSIRSKFLILLLLFAFIPMLLAGIFNFNNYKNSLVDDHLSDMRDIAAFKADKIETYFAGLKSDIEITRNRYVITNNLPVLDRFVRQPAAPEFIEAKKNLDGQLPRMLLPLDLSDIFLVNPQGDIVYSSDSGRYKEYFLNRLPGPSGQVFDGGKNKIVFSDIFLDKTKNDKQAMLIAAPVFDLNNVFIGEVVFEADIHRVTDLVQDKKGLGDTGETLIAKKTSGQLMFLSPLRYEPKSFLTKRAIIGRKIAMPIQEAVQGRNGSGFSIDYRGKEVVAAWRHIPSLDWGIVAKIDADEALADIRKLRNRLLFIWVFIFLVGTVTANWAARSITDPIKKLSQGVQIVGKGNLDHKVGTYQKDEIGQLSRSFDKMTADLKVITASRDELDKEIVERKRAQEELGEAYEELQAHREELEATNEELRVQTDELQFVNQQLKESHDGLEQRVKERTAQITVERQRLFEAQKEIERAKRLSDIGTLAATVAHELRNPLAAIRIAAYNIKRKAGDPLLDKHFATIDKKVSESDHIIGNLLFYSRIRPPRCEKINICDVIEESLAVVGSRYPGSAAIVNNRYRAADAYVEADPVQMAEVFSNVLSNAYDALADRQGRIDLEVSFDRDWAAVHVKDDGPGIGEEDLKKVFDPFFTTKAKGTGLGLSVCKQIVSLHAGTLDISSKLGEGTIVTIKLPIRKVKSA